MWTEESEDHIWAGHEVTPAEVEEVVNTRPRLVEPGQDDTELVSALPTLDATSWSSSPTRPMAETMW